MAVRPARPILMLLATTMAASTLSSPVVCADDWPQWRGPRRDGVSLETGLLRFWPAGGPKMAWNFTGLGAGYSSVVVGDGRIFTMGKRDADVIVTCVDAATHAALWSQKISTTSRTPCSTPTLDGDRLYVLDPDGDLVCQNANSGEILWQKSFLDDFGGRMMSGRGYGESPLIDGDKLICTPGGPEAALVALQKETGALLWKSKLPDIGKAGQEGAGFSSVVVTEASGIRQYVQLVGRGVIGVDARDGHFLWGYNAIANQTANIPTPVVHNELVFSANGYTSGSVLLKLISAPDAANAEIKTEVAYSLTSGQFQNHHGGVVRIGNYLYGGHGNNNGLPTCLELSTGRIVWKRRGPGIGSAAVAAADGMLYFRYQNGIVALVEASERGYHLQGTLEIPGAGGDSWAHPVVANGHLFLREQETLWVYDLCNSDALRADEPDVSASSEHPAVKELRKRGVSIEWLTVRGGKTSPVHGDPGSSASIRARRSSEPGRRFYDFLTPATAPKRTEPPFVVGVNDKHLSAAGTVTEEVVDLIKDLPGTLVVSLAGTAISDTGIRQLCTLRNLAGLNLESCRQITDTGMEPLAALNQLRVLILAGTGISNGGVETLVASRSLVALDLEACDGITGAACESLGTIRQLEALGLKKTGFEAQRVTDAGLQKLKSLANLEVLNLYGNAVTDAGLAHLQPLAKLRELNLSLLPLTDSGLSHLQSLKALERLELLYSEGFSGPMLTNAGIESLRPMTNLTTLNLTGAKITDEGLERLSVLNKLTNLQLVRTNVSPDGLKALRAALPACQVIR